MENNKLIKEADESIEKLFHPNQEDKTEEIKNNQIEFDVPINEDGIVDRKKLESKIFDAVKSHFDIETEQKPNRDNIFDELIGLKIDVLETLSELENSDKNVNEEELLNNLKRRSKMSENVYFEKSEFKNIIEKASGLVNNFLNQVIEDMFVYAISSLKISDSYEMRQFIDGIIKSIGSFDIDKFIDGIETKNRWEEMAFGSSDKEHLSTSPMKIGEIVVKNGKSFTNEELFLNLLEITYGGTCDFVKIRTHYKIWKDDDFDLLINNLVSCGKITFKDGVIELVSSGQENVG